MDTKVLWKPSVSMTVRKDLCLAVQQGLSKCGTLKSQKVCCHFSAFMTFVKNWDIRKNCIIKLYLIYLPTCHAMTGWAASPKREHLGLIIGSGVLHVECHLSANQQCQSTEHNQTASCHPWSFVITTCVSLPPACYEHLYIMTTCMSWLSLPVYDGYLYVMSTCISWPAAWPPVCHSHLYFMATCIWWPPVCHDYHCLYIMNTCMSWPPVCHGCVYIMATCISWPPVCHDYLCVYIMASCI